MMLAPFFWNEDQPHSGWYVSLRLSSEDSEEIERMSIDLESRLLGKYYIKLEICIITYNENVEVYVEKHGVFRSIYTRSLIDLQ